MSANDGQRTFTLDLYCNLMSFKKPFRAVPITLGRHYRAKQQQRERRSALRLLGVAAAVGAIGGAGSTALSGQGKAAITAFMKPIAVQAGIMREREPQSGDFWSGCDDARAAGTAPIYSAEPGYRKEMDGDGDGVACEPYR